MLATLEGLHEMVESLSESGCFSDNGFGIKMTSFAKLVSRNLNSINTI